MKEPCGEPHPEVPDAYCDKPTPCWGYHESVAADLTWDGTPLPEVTTMASRKGKVAVMVESAEPSKMTGPPQVGVPSAAVAAWEASNPEWIEQAKAVLKDVCRSHQTFTTRLLWTRLASPPERRAMVVVIRHGLKRGWMVEDGAQRETEPYVTADGQVFPLNKLVPIYRSLLT